VQLLHDDYDLAPVFLLFVLFVSDFFYFVTHFAERVLDFCLKFACHGCRTENLVFHLHKLKTLIFLLEFYCAKAFRDVVE